MPKESLDYTTSDGITIKRIDAVPAELLDAFKAEKDPPENVFSAIKKATIIVGAFAKERPIRFITGNVWAANPKYINVSSIYLDQEHRGGELDNNLLVSLVDQSILAGYDKVSIGGNLIAGRATAKKGDKGAIVETEWYSQ